LRERVIPLLFAAAIGIGSGIYIWEPAFRNATSPKGLAELELERQQRLHSTPANHETSHGSVLVSQTSDSRTAEK